MNSRISEHPDGFCGFCHPHFGDARVQLQTSSRRLLNRPHARRKNNRSHWQLAVIASGSKMIMDESDPRTVLDKATEVVRDATEAVQATSQSVAGP